MVNPYQLAYETSVSVYMLCRTSNVTFCNSNFLPTQDNNDAAIDTGCTDHTWPLKSPVTKFSPTPPAHAIIVKLPNNATMLQTHHGEVPIPDLPASAKPVRIFSDHGYKPLLFLGKFADAGYTFHGDAHLMILSHPLH